MYLRTDNGAGKAQAEISACHKFAPNFNQADWPHLNFNVINIFDRNSESKNWAETCSRYGATDLFAFFPLCPLCECLPYAGIPSTLSQTQHRSVVIWHLKCLYPEAEVNRGKFRNVPFPCQSGCKVCTGPHTAPQNAELPANVNGLDITSSTLHSYEVYGALNLGISYWHSLSQPAMMTT